MRQLAFAMCGSGIAKMVFAALALAAPLHTAAAETIYVDRNAPGPLHDGSSWCNAFTELWQALASASEGATIRLADGVYPPDTTGLVDPRDATFTIPADLTIAGAYAGCGAPDPDERDPLVYVTTLSGDLAGNGATDRGGDNAYHVVTAADEGGPATTLSGVVIRDGNAGGGLGGGILALGGRLVLSVCTLEANQAWRGGAVYVESGELHLFQCRFTGNLSTGEGGAIFDANSYLEAHNCLFTLNTAGNDGGAIFCDVCSADFLNCSFGGNVSASRGGAIYDYVGVVTYAGNSIFWGNSDMSGDGETAQIFVNPSNVLAIDFSCVQGWTGDYGGEGNIGDDPLLADWPAGDLHLLPGSPCIDHGSNDLVGSQLDLDGNPRIVNGTVDIGCYEFQGNSGLPDPRPVDENARILNIDPRPGEPEMSVRFLPPREGAWSLTVYTVTGRRLDLLDAGTGAGGGPHETIWEGRDASQRRVPTGVYILVLAAPERLLDTRKAVYLR